MKSKETIVFIFFGKSVISYKYLVVLESLLSRIQEVCLLWQYGFWSFQMGGTKLERFLPMNQPTQRKLLNFENWVNGELSKIGPHFSNKVIQKLIFKLKF